MGKRENSIEKYFKDQVKERLGRIAITRKFVSPGNPGVSDQLLFLEGATTIHVECKTLDGTHSPKQRREQGRMIALGFVSVVVDSKLKVDQLLTKIEVEFLPC